MRVRIEDLGGLREEVAVEEGGGLNMVGNASEILGSRQRVRGGGERGG